MGKRLGAIGAISTLLYLILLGGLAGIRFEELKSLPLNSLGDFLAGAFTPVAFLWLVLGFLQQGQELRQGTEALLLQAQELRHSVEQQSISVEQQIIMANAATLQIEAQNREYQMRLDEREAQLEPVLEFHSMSRGGSADGRSVTSTTGIRNDGGEIKKISLKFYPAIGSVEEILLVRLPTKANEAITFEFYWSAEIMRGTCTIGYIRLDGKPGVKEFCYEINPADPYVEIYPVVSLG